jgi:hypothetical protein
MHDEKEEGVYERVVSTNEYRCVVFDVERRLRRRLYRQRIAAAGHQQNMTEFS